MGTFEDLTEKSISVESGHPVIIDLPPIESNPPPEVTWDAEDRPLPYDIKYAVTRDNQLIILSSEESDQKAYRLVVWIHFCG